MQRTTPPSAAHLYFNSDLFSGQTCAMNASGSPKRRIGVITTSRADYSHLYWPLRELSAHPDVDLAVFALGAHLSPEFGST